MASRWDSTRHLLLPIHPIRAISGYRENDIGAIGHFKTHQMNTVIKWILIILFFPISLLFVAYFNQRKDYSAYADDEEEYTVDSRMVKINITDPDRELVPFLDEFEGIHEIVYYAGYLYVSEVLSNKISRFKLPISTGIYPIASQEVSLYPNPTSDILNIEGKVDVKYNIYSIDGKKISNGNTNSDSQIDVSNLPIGSYILFLSDGGVGSFQKL